MKLKKYVFIPIILILCVIAYAFLAKPTIEKHTWVLSYAQQAESPMFVVAHNDTYDFSDIDSSLFEFSKPINLTLEAKNGKLLLTDSTNGNTYQGSYTIKSRGKHIHQSYSVVVDGVEGNANVDSKSGRTLFISIGDYCLHFEAK